MSASANAPASSGGTSSPVSPSETTSGIPPTRLPTTARPRHAASITTRPIPSERDGSTSSVDASSAVATPSVVREGVHSTRRRQLVDEPLRNRGERALTHDVQSRSRHRLGHAAPRFGQHVESLVPLEHADEERARCVRKWRDGVRREGLEIHERRELGHGLDALCPDELGRVRADRPDPVGTVERAASEHVGKGIEQPPRSRAVEPRRRAPVAVKVEDHGAGRPRKATGDQRESRLLRPLRDDRVGLESTKLAGDPPREPQVVEGAVERSDRGRTREHQPRVGRVLPVEGGPELPPVELAGKRLEAPLQRPAEREAETTSTDEEDTRAAHRAAPTRIASSLE